MFKRENFLIKSSTRKYGSHSHQTKYTDTQYFTSSKTLKSFYYLVNVQNLGFVAEI